MKKSVFLGVFVAGVVLFGSCGGNKQQQYVEEDDNSTSMEDKEVLTVRSMASVQQVRR